MTNLLILMLALFGYAVSRDGTCSFFGRHGRVMTLDLQRGKLRTNYILPGVAGTVKFRRNNSFYRKKTCTFMADLKVTFDRYSDSRKRSYKKLLKIEMEIDRQRGRYLFNVGDSATNNAWGGDSSTQLNDAEVMGYNNNALIYYSDKCMYQKEKIINSLANAKTAILWVGNEYTRLQTKNSAGFVLFDKEYCRHCLFALNMQRDQCWYCRNLDIYVALNNVVLGTYRNGYGICKAHFSWERI